MEDRVQQDLDKMGIVEPGRPAFDEDHATIFRSRDGNPIVGQFFDGTIPTSFARLSLTQLESLHTLCTAWLQYVGYNLMKYKTAKAFSKVRKDAKWSMVRGIKKTELEKEGFKATGRDQAAADLAMLDRRFVDSNAVYLNAQAMVDVLTNLWDIAEYNVNAVSRAITVRGVDAEHAHRGRGFGSGGPPNVDRYVGKRFRSAESSEDETVEADEQQSPAMASKFTRGPIKYERTATEPEAEKRSVRPAVPRVPGRPTIKRPAPKG